MIDYINKDLFYQSSISKKLKIQVVNGIAIDNSLLYSEDFELKESISSSETLRFGNCESSCLKFKVRNDIGKLLGEKLVVSSVLNNDSSHPFTYGTYFVAEDKPNADRSYRNIVAYDKLYEILNSDVAAWYNSALPNSNSTLTLKSFRNSFFAYFGVTQNNVNLANDNMTVAKTIDPVELSGKTVLNAICELNGSFGIIDRNNKFKYVVLKPYTKSLYPATTLYPNSNLYPSNGKYDSEITKSNYISLDYEDYETRAITKLQIRQEESDIGAIVGTGDNCYIVQDNFLVYGKSAVELSTIATNLFSVIQNVQYMPINVSAVGNPCVEVGDSIKIYTKNKTLFTFVLNRTLKGIQALYDTYESKGEYEQSEKVNSVNTSIVQLKGKTNKLVRTVDELSSEINDTENGLKTKITQNANSITSEVQRATSAEESLSSRITQTDQKITLEVNSLQKEIDGSITSYNVVETPTLTNYPAWDFTYNIPCNGTVLCGDVGWQYKDEYYQKDARSLAFDTTTFISYRFLKGDDGEWHWIEISDSEYSYILEQVSKLKIEAGKIEATVESNKTYSDEQIESLSSRITQTATSISSEVTRASTAESSLSSRITQNANSINLKVSKGSVISEINQTAETVTISASKIDLNGLVTATEFTSKYATIETLAITNARVDYIASDYATISQLNTTNLEVSGKASVGDLNAVSARVGTIETNYITADTVSANYATISSLNAVNAKIDNLNVNTLLANTSVESSVAYLKELHVAKIHDKDSLGLKPVWKNSATLGWYLSGVFK